MSMTERTKPLKEFKPEFDYLVAIDSDGCVFDTMGIKQRECFCPMMIAYFDLQPVAKAARECKEFADLFSKTRGSNRHKTIVRILTELLPSHPQVKKRNFDVPRFEHYCKWVNNAHSLLSNEGLKKAIAETENDTAREELKIALKWSMRVNELVTEIVKNIPPFPYFQESATRISQKADIIVCSATPTEALQREWKEHGIADYPRMICGQEMGTKSQHLHATAGKYKKNHTLMIGDAPGDLKSAKANNALFYPINPGNEEMSWRRFAREAFDKFIKGEYAGDYEKSLIQEFDKHLPENPPWKSNNR